MIHEAEVRNYRLCGHSPATFDAGKTFLLVSTLPESFIIIGHVFDEEEYFLFSTVTHLKIFRIAKHGGIKINGAGKFGVETTRSSYFIPTRAFYFLCSNCFFFQLNFRAAGGGG